MTVRAETEVTLTRVNDGDNGIKVYDGTAGSVVTVSNASEYPALELVANIEPIQPNDYSSVWVGGAGKNVCVPFEGTKYGIVRTVNDDGTVSITGKSTANSWAYLEEYYDLPYCGIDVGDTISIYSDVYIAVMAYNGSTSLGNKSSKDGNSATYTIPANTTRLRIIQYPKSVTPVIDEEFDTTAKYWVSKSAFSSWEPYENICPIYGHDHCNVVVSPTLLDTDGTTYTTNFPQTVYGGTLDVVEGTLTVTHGYETVDGNHTMSNQISARDRVFFQLTAMESGSHDADGFNKCNQMIVEQNTGNTFTYPNIRLGANNNYVYLNGVKEISGVTDLASLKTWLNSNPVTFTYPLATPITYKVPPLGIELITGTCNVWATTGDITDFRYAEISPATLETFGEARKIAVKYVTDMGDDGIIVHPENDTSNYAKINAEGMDIVKNDESIAFYGEFSRVGRDNRSRTITSPKGVSMYTDDNVLAFSIGSSVNTGSVSVNEWVNYYATLNTSSTLTVPGLSQGAVGGDIQLGITASYYDYNSIPNRQMTETNENIYFEVGTSATETWTVGALNDYTITIAYDGSTSFTVTNDIPITEQNYIRVAFVEYDKIDIIADVKLGSKTLSDGVWYTEARVVLWENESPKSNFTAQTVSLGPVDQFHYCDELEITFINSVSGLRYGSARGPIDRVNHSDTHTILSQGAQTKLYSREVYFNYVGQVVFSNGNYDGTNGSQYCVPQQIIGIRHI